LTRKPDCAAKEMPTVVPGPKKSPNASPGRRNWLMLVMGCVEVQAASVQIFRRFPVALRQTGPAAAMFGCS